MSHIVELDDVHRNSILHPAATTIPAALSLAECNEIDGRMLTSAIVAGYEAGIRVGEAVGRSHYEFWHNTGTCGTFGAAAASGKIFGLDMDEMANTLGNAGTQAAGLWQFQAEGAMSKHLHPGRAASNGVLSALLARSGFTGSTTIIEGERGFCKATSSDFNLEKITENLGERYKILETSFKNHASCRHTHPAVDAALQIREREMIDHNDISKVRIETYPDALKIAGIQEPRTPYEAKFSLKYCTSTALYTGRLGPEEFTESFLTNHKIRRLMDRTEIIIDEILGREYPAKWPSRVEVTTKGGGRYSAQVDHPLGDPENPLPMEKLVEKFKMLASKELSEKKVETVIETVFKLEKVSNMGELTELLTPTV
jgi:2-methylcitrate dehydratase PrpD